MTSRARNQNAPYNNLILGTAPDSWGVWFPEDDRQVSWQTFLDEVAEAGYEFIETGPFGFLPTDPEVLREETEKRGIRVVDGTQGATLHKPEEYEAAEKSLRAVAEVLKALDARFLV
ncbi:sugar phosphate isomerase/epimerase [Flaviflexus massiliensis]|uniref:sugar phosphate isomerase/epimerase n=1 Tax=Flaviflexus massiliensis TaxID=1522309 RepID=UPI000A665E2C|nr:sugar phosphate isomerase/epimerase [Flaviflexus massiliensis]